VVPGAKLITPLPFFWGKGIMKMFNGNWDFTGKRKTEAVSRFG